MKNALRISIMGPKVPCGNCKKTRKNVFLAMAEYHNMEVEVTINHLELNTEKSIAAFGVLKGPVVIFDDTLVFEGKIPSKSEIQQAVDQFLSM